MTGLNRAVFRLAHTALAVLLAVRLPVIPVQSAPADTVVGTGSAASCTDTALVLALGTGGAITFSCGGTATIAISTVKVIAHDTTLDGGGLITLSGGFSTRLFLVNGGVTLTLEHIVLDGAASTGGDGGAIANFGRLIVDHSTIQHSQTDSAHSGGAISTSGPVTITASVLANNSAGSAGALFAGPGQTVVVSDTTISGNQAVSTTAGIGGAIWVGEQAQVSITGGAIQSNTARFGGGLYLDQNSVVTFTSSEAPALLSGNLATFAGGGLYAGLARASLTNVTLSGNLATNSNPGIQTFGGGIDNFQSTVVVTDSTLLSNTAGYGGGAFVAGGVLTLEGVAFTGNAATVGFGGGVGNDSGGVLAASNSTFTANTAAADGGGLDNNVGTTSLTGATFTGNSAGLDGGGVADEQGPLSLATATFTGNSAANDGGGVFSFDGPTDLTDTLIISNTAANGAGAFNADGQMTLTGVTLSDNATGGFGGGVFNSIGGTTMTNATLSGNSAGQSGGGVFNSGGGVSLTNATLNGNSATLSGGGAYNSIGRLTLTEATLSGNSTGQSGGGLYADAISTTDLTDVTLSGNSAALVGGGLYSSGILVIAQSTFTGNTAVFAAGLDVEGGSASLTNATLSGNSASSAGGAIRQVSGQVLLTHVTLSGNSAVDGGGLDESSPFLTHTLVLTNTVLAAGATGGNCFTGSLPAGIITSGGHNLSSDGSCALSLNQPGDRNITDPKLRLLANNGGPTQTHLPGTGSPAVDAIPAGVNGCGATITSDQRGAPRPIGAGCDIGAVESGWVHPALWLPLVRR